MTDPILKSSTKLAWSFIAPDIEGTHAIAAAVATAAPLGTVLGLSGPLGAGKTEFVRGFVENLGPKGQVASPTFVLEAVYQGRKDGREIEICHWDLYRLARSDETTEIASGLDLERSISLVEWPDRVPAVYDLLSAKIEIGFLEPQKDPENGRFSLSNSPSSEGSALPDDPSSDSAAGRVISIELAEDGVFARRLEAFALSLRR